MKRNFYHIILKPLIVLIILVPIVIGWLPTFVIATEYTFAQIDYPGATLTIVDGINDSGMMVGRYEDSTGGHGFLYAQGGFTPINVPGAIGTYAYGINDSGNIVGHYWIGPPLCMAFSIQEEALLPLIIRVQLALGPMG